MVSYSEAWGRPQPDFDAGGAEVVWYRAKLSFGEVLRLVLPQGHVGPAQNELKLRGVLYMSAKQGIHQVSTWIPIYMAGSFLQSLGPYSLFASLSRYTYF